MRRVLLSLCLLATICYINGVTVLNGGGSTFPQLAYGDAISAFKCNSSIIYFRCDAPQCMYRTRSSMVFVYVK
jgi:hypothetical protein